MTADVSTRRPRLPWPFPSRIEVMRQRLERGTVDTAQPATCVGCGCTDQLGCRDGCSWLAVNRDTREGVCSNCGSHLDAWKARQ